MLQLYSGGYNKDDLYFLQHLLETGLDVVCIHSNEFTQNTCITCKYKYVCKSIQTLANYSGMLADSMSKESEANK